MGASKLPTSISFIPAIIAFYPPERGRDNVALHFVEAGRMPIAAQLAAIQRQQEKLDVRCFFAALPASRHHFPMHHRAVSRHHHDDRVVVELDGFAHGVLHSIAEVVLLRVRLKREAARC